MNEPETIKKVLTEMKTIAVVGLSPKPFRASHHVAEYMQKNGYKIIPVYPREELILGEKVYRSLAQIREKVDVVCVFRKPEEAMNIVKEAIEIRAKAVWMQDGVINEEAAKFAEKNGIIVVMDMCMYREHARL